MYQSIFSIIILFIVISCTSYTNEARYTISKNEQVEIYYSTNSCCFYCISNKNKLNHVQFIKDTLLDSGKKNVEGGNYTSAYIFQGKSVGIDTVELTLSGGGSSIEECESNTTPTEKYIIEVTE